MTDRPSLPQHDDHAAWAQAALRRQVERLDELAELGLTMARAIEAERAEGAVTAFSRVAKAVRLTALVQSRLIKDIGQVRTNDRLFGGEAREAAADAAAQLDPAYHHKFRVERIVERLIKAESGDDEDRIDRLAIETGERLDDEDLYGDVLTRPIGELVALICRDLGLEPDWGRLAEEAWAQEEIASGAWPPSPSRGEGRVTPGLQDMEREAAEHEAPRLHRPTFEVRTSTPIPAFPPRGGRNGAHPP